MSILTRFYLANLKNRRKVRKEKKILSFSSLAVAQIWQLDTITADYKCKQTNDTSRSFSFMRLKNWHQENNNCYYLIKV